MNTAAIIRSPQLSAVKEQFENWRSNRISNREPIPQPLWQSAADLCRAHGITHVSRTLRLSYAELKKRVSPAEPAATAPEFMELDIGCFAGQWHLECDRADGARLRLSGSVQMPHIENMLGAFLS
ncbi:MAG: hypothetical protein JRE12_01020 [Deltaproteobacteria bacterium]|nr:hypothetical protein [Deltaproteobacteria bacterium]